MARKTFISYKYDESYELRDKIIAALGEDAMYYQGETSESPSLTGKTTERIRKNLTDMMYDTSVTIVIVSPNIMRSNWIDVEIEYCLKKCTRNERTSMTNGIVGVIQKVNGSYLWLVNNTDKYNWHLNPQCKDFMLFPIIRKNRYNSKQHLNISGKFSQFQYCEFTDSYISLIAEDYFLAAPNWYIENAYSKSQNSHQYCITKLRRDAEGPGWPRPLDYRSL